MDLIKYNTACKALAEARNTDEVKNILNVSEAMRAYAVQANNLQLEVDALAIKARAKRKLGEMIKKQKETVGLNTGAKGIGTSAVPKDNRTPTLADIGIDKKLSSECQKIADIPDEKFESILQEAEIETKKVTNNMLVNFAKEIEKQDRIKNEKNIRIDEISEIEIRHGDFKDVLSDVINIDAIITDPPYPKEYIQCFSDLSKYAMNHLKNDGWLIVYSGQYNLPEVIQRLSEYMTYVWTFCLYHVGKNQLVNGVNIMCGWKPVLIFSKGQKKMRFSAYDVLISEQMEKSNHEWQQSESGVKSLIEIFSKPNELIVDPFAGSGTFLKVSNELGRHAIGAEIC